MSSYTGIKYSNVRSSLNLSFSLSAVFLTFFGLASIGLSCLMALFLYHVVFGIPYLGILNGVAAFVIIGIGELGPHPRSYNIYPGSLPSAQGTLKIYHEYLCIAQFLMSYNLCGSQLTCMENLIQDTIIQYSFVLQFLFLPVFCVPGFFIYFPLMYFCSSSFLL